MHEIQFTFMKIFAQIYQNFLQMQNQKKFTVQFVGGE